LDIKIIDECSGNFSRIIVRKYMHMSWLVQSSEGLMYIRRATVHRPVLLPVHDRSTVHGLDNFRVHVQLLVDQGRHFIGFHPTGWCRR